MKLSKQTKALTYIVCILGVLMVVFPIYVTIVTAFKTPGESARSFLTPPTSLYLAMQCGLKVANYPLIPEDFERRQLPPALVPHRKKIFGLTIDPQRLSQIRNERRPGSRYADLVNCRNEVAEAEAMMRRSGIRWLSTTTKSIEEIATTILQEVRPERLQY